MLPGAHACLSNIADDYTFKKDVAFVYNGKPKVHKAGTKCGLLMRKWVDLRKNNPEVRRMLEKIEVYQQPSGFVDNVIFSWITQAQAEHTGCSFEQ